MTYRLIYSKKALSDIQKLKAANLTTRAKNLTELLRDNPYQNPPRYEKLVGNLSGAYSRRINRKHRLVYQVDAEKKLVRILSLWSQLGVLVRNNPFFLNRPQKFLSPRGLFPIPLALSNCL